MIVTYDHRIFTNQRYGGISRYFTELAARLGRLDNVTARVWAGVHVNEYLEPLAREVQVVGRKVPAIRRTGILRRYATELMARKTLSRGDIHHTTYYSKRPTWEYGKVKVCTAFDMIHELGLEGNSSSLDEIIRAKKATLEQADLIICISETTRNDLLKFYDIAASKLQVIYLGAEFSNFNALARPVAEPYFLYAGQRNSYKNFSRLLEAYALTASLRREFKLVAFGGLPPQIDELALIHRLGLNNRVIFVRGNDQLLAAYMKFAHYFVYPSLYEGFGLPPLEAMHYGCPVVASNSGSIPEVVGEAALLFDPRAIEDIGEKMQQLAFDDTLRNSLMILGQARAKLFRWENSAAETHAAYLRLLENTN